MDCLVNFGYLERVVFFFQIKGVIRINVVVQVVV